MLTKDEQETLARCERQLRGGVYLDRGDFASVKNIIDRVTSQRAVCDEFERLARDRGVDTVEFPEGPDANGADYVAVFTANSSTGFEGSLADAIEALGDGKGG